MTIPHLLHVHRFTLEATAPVMISSGGEDPLLDNLLARDANGMPMIPATTLAGALRVQLSDRADALFGYQSLTDGQRSALTFTDALAHCGNDRPRDGWQVLPDDPVTQLLLRDSPVTRQHVRLNAHGVTDGEGKFERAAVPAGTRFTFEISLWSDSENLDAVAQIVRGGLFLGGAKRSGYGAFKCTSDGGRSFDMKDPKEADAYRAYASKRLGEDSFDMRPSGSNTAPAAGWHLRGQIEGPLLIGSPKQDGKGGRQPYSEQRIKWRNGTGKVAPTKPTLPGSAIKGPLRHRTRFHLSGQKDVDDQIEAIFGSTTSATGGKAGVLRFHDAEIIGARKISLTHVSLDRFTGGARDKSGALFSDDMLWRPELDIRIDQLGPLPDEAETAFEAALNDLKTGLLGIGAEWGEGAGVFEYCDVGRKGAADESE